MWFKPAGDIAPNGTKEIGRYISTVCRMRQHTPFRLQRLCDTSNSDDDSDNTDGASRQAEGVGEGEGGGQGEPGWRHPWRGPRWRSPHPAPGWPRPGRHRPPGAKRSAADQARVLRDALAGQVCRCRNTRARGCEVPDEVRRVPVPAHQILYVFSTIFLQ